MLTAEQAAKKWFDRASVAGDAIRDGVNAIREEANPMRLAGEAQDRWLAGVQRAAQQNKFRTNVQRVTLAEWRRAMLEKGIQNYTNGLQLGRAKMARFLQAFLPFVANAKASLPPRGTLAQNIARSRAMIEALAGFKTQGGGGMAPASP